MPNWRKLSKTRMAAMAYSANVMNEFLSSHSYISDFLASDESEDKGEELGPNGEIIWDTLVKSSITQRARNAIAKCFEIAIGERVIPGTVAMSAVGSNFGRHIYNGHYGYLPIVVVGNPNSHNYSIGRVCILRYSGGRGGALRHTGTTGNNLPDTFRSNLVIPSVDDLMYFFSSRTGPRLDHIRRFYTTATIKPLIDNREEAIKWIEEYSTVFDRLKKAQLIPYR